MKNYSVYTNDSTDLKPDKKVVSAWLWCDIYESGLFRRAVC